MCRWVLAGSLLNLEAVTAAAREAGEDVVVVCAGVLGAFAIDDAYCAGRIVELLGGEPTDAAAAAVRLSRSFPSAEEGLGASQSARNLLAAGPRERHRLVRARERARRRSPLHADDRPRGRAFPASAARPWRLIALASLTPTASGWDSTR